MAENPETMDLTPDEMIELINKLELESEPVVYVMDPYKFSEIQQLVHACWHMLHSKNPFDNDMAEMEIEQAMKLFPIWMKDPEWKEDDDLDA